MAKKMMTKAQTVTTLAEQAGISKKAMAEILNNLVMLAYKEAKNGFVVPGLGKLVVAKRKARMGRNPATGAAIKIPAKTVCKFRMAKACKDAVLK